MSDKCSRYIVSILEKGKWRKLRLALLLPLASLACLSLAAMRSNARAQAAIVEIPEVLKAQAAAWNRGDLDAFMASYVESEEMSYTSGGKVVWGFEAVRKRYVDSYGTRKESMGRLSFSNLKIVSLSRTSALCVGQWHLERAAKAPSDGVFSLVFVQEKDGWKIVHDHTSVAPKS